MISSSVRHPREPLPIDAATLKAWQEGKLEQTCPDCGRWSAATSGCSWCYRQMRPADYYKNGDAKERAARMPRTAPADPPTEYRDSASWPKSWGPCPYRKKETHETVQA